MTRLYFDCLIKAAYMAKEFGVRIYHDIPKKDGKSVASVEYPIEVANLGTNRLKRKIWHKTDGSDGIDFDWEDTGEQEYLTHTSSENKLYVAPESEHIFEPRIDDFVKISDSYNEKNSYDDDLFIEAGRICSKDIEKKWWEIRWTRDEGCFLMVSPEYFQIIMRDNKHFFAASVEEVSND